MASPLRPAWVPLAALAAAVASAPALAQTKDANVAALTEKYRCTICHDATETKAGPSWADIAAQYRGNPRATAVLVGVVKKGQHGGGPWPMPPLPEVPDADAMAIVRYILATKAPAGS
jgi:cytochrome c